MHSLTHARAAHVCEHGYAYVHMHLCVRVPAFIQLRYSQFFSVLSLLGGRV
uniref:Uncharacterized protein n=1 Tax=Octopus bimaculoides TaxID=37653 RepID=A0A0L8I6N6_OCTBM